MPVEPAEPTENHITFDSPLLLEFVQSPFNKPSISYSFLGWLKEEGCHQLFRSHLPASASLSLHQLPLPYTSAMMYWAARVLEPEQSDHSQKLLKTFS